MPAPYTDTEQDALIDQLIADLAAETARVDALETRVTAIETTLGIIEPNVAALNSDVASLQTDQATANANIGTLQTSVSGLTDRVDTIENVTIPAVDTAQDDVKTLVVATRQRQQNDPEQLDKPTPVLRPSVERVRRPDGRYVQRAVRPR